MANRVLLGNLNGVYGLFVSQPGYDVTTCSPSQLIFDSTAGMAQCLIQGTTTQSSSAPYTTTIYYNFGFVPIVLCNSYQLFGTSLQLNPATATSTNISTLYSTPYFIFRPN